MGELRSIFVAVGTALVLFAGLVAVNGAAASGEARLTSDRIFNGGPRRCRCALSDDYVWVGAGRTIVVDYEAKIAQPHRFFARISIIPSLHLSGLREDIWVEHTGAGTLRRTAEQTGVYRVEVRVEAMDFNRAPSDITLRWRLE